MKKIKITNNVHFILEHELLVVSFPSGTIVGYRRYPKELDKTVIIDWLEKNFGTKIAHDYLDKILSDQDLEWE